MWARSSEIGGMIGGRTVGFLNRGIGSGILAGMIAGSFLLEVIYRGITGRTIHLGRRHKEEQ